MQVTKGTWRMREQCVPGSLSSSPAQEPGNEATQLHACCVRDMLQTSRDASNLVESFRVVETLLLFVTLGSSCRNPSYLATFLP